MKSSRYITTALLIGFIVSGQFSLPVLALEDQFEVSATVIAADVTAPSIPTGLTATAISSSQINLAWTASTDDVAVTGYQVFRDSVFIATSSGTTYADTGLSPGTAYFYTVTAFDAAVNISNQSATATATTSAVTATDSGGGGGSVSYQNPFIFDLVVSPSLYGAIITFHTDHEARAKVVWGRSSDYEGGVLVSELYTTNHEVKISNLLPGTRYFFGIELVDAIGRRSVLVGQEFVTLSLPDNLPPANVSNFTAQPQAERIALSWRNPSDSDFSKVRIVRSDKFFPNDPFDGEVIYEGEGESFADSKVMAGRYYYYTAFTSDHRGNYSSGAVTSARILLPGQVLEPSILEDLPIIPAPDPAIQNLKLVDFDFYQDNQPISFIGETVPIDGGKNLIISLDYDKVPELLKTIVVTLYDPTDPEKQFSFLLRINNDKSAYVAQLASLKHSGKYAMKITILDYKNRGLKKLDGSLLAFAVSGDESDSPFLTLLTLFGKAEGLLILLIVVVLLLYHQRQNKRKERQSFTINNA